jgi:starch phosphorylase
MLSTILGGLDPRALYLGFARRFAPYKRARLLFSDIERLRRILGAGERPVRILVAGKAHPRDGQGQELIQRIVQLARSPELAGRVVFVEDYDVTIARALVQGVDVWLNTPTRMEEASGTSGMKAAANGVLNLSIGDGWWPEAADGRNGWTIGGPQVYRDAELQNQADATALYGLLEEEIVPLFFDRDASGLPRGWIERMLHCLGTVPARFNTDRMLQEYQRRAYEPLARSYFAQQAAKKAPARELGREIARVRKGFAQLRIVAANTVELQEFKVGQHLEVGMDVDLGPLGLDDVLAELVVQRPDPAPGEVVVVPLTPVGAPRGSVHSYAGSYRVERAGRYSYGLRARGCAGGEPLRGLVTWA